MFVPVCPPAEDLGVNPAGEQAATPGLLRLAYFGAERRPLLRVAWRQRAALSYEWHGIVPVFLYDVALARASAERRDEPLAAMVRIANAIGHGPRWACPSLSSRFQST